MEDEPPPHLIPPETSEGTEAEAPDAVSPKSDTEPGGDSGEVLDGVRIRHLSALRRSTYRARSFAVVFSAGGFVVAIKLVLMTITSFRLGGIGPWPLGLMLFSILSAVVGFHFAHRAIELHREASQPMPMPLAPPGGPDFSTLSDGSQQWENLERVIDDDRTPEHPGSF